MSLRNIIIAGLCISGLVANALESVVPTLDAAAKYQASLIAAKHIVVFEGLPHQSWDRELLATESKRADTRMIWEYRFYTPSVVATNAKELRQVLSYPGSIVVYGGPKACGGYHPDYCISWQAGKSVHRAFVCLGCHEVVLYDGKETLIYDLGASAYEKLNELLAVYRLKRPKGHVQ